MERRHNILIGWPEWQEDAKRAAEVTADRELGKRKLREERRQWTASCRLSREEMEDFIALCKEQGTTRYTVIKTMIREYMKAASA